MPDPQPLADPGAAPALRGTALVVDDDALVRSLVRHTLKRAGLAVDECEGGGAALERLAAGTAPIDVVVLDMTMPGLSGVETAARMRASHPRLPIVLTSGYAPRDVDPQVVTAFIQKPYRQRDLVALVARVLEASRP